MVLGVFYGVPGHPVQIQATRRTPQGRIQGSFLPLEEPSSEALLGKNGLQRGRLLCEYIWRLLGFETHARLV